MLFHQQFDGTARFLHVDDIVGIFQRQRPPAVHVEVGLEFPVAGVGEEIEEHGHLPRARRIHVLGAAAGVGIGHVLAVHGGVPEAVAEDVGIHVPG